MTNSYYYFLTIHSSIDVSEEEVVEALEYAMENGKFPKAGVFVSDKVWAER